MSKDEKTLGAIILGIAGLIALIALTGKKKCHYCGGENEKSATICKYCGHRI